MRKIFCIGNKFLTDPRIEPLFDRIIPMRKYRMDGYIRYSGESNLFNTIEGDVAKIGYKDGQFKAFEANEIEDGWLYLDQKNNSFDWGLNRVPENINSKDNLTAAEMANAALDAIADYNEIMSGIFSFDDIEVREDFISYLSYHQLYALANNIMIGMKFDSKKAGGRKMKHVKKYLLNWKPE